MKVRFLLTGEGTSDLRLQSHIENILIAEGFDEVDGETPDLSVIVPRVGHAVKDKLAALVKYYPDVDVIFVHRDSDNAGCDARIAEIYAGGEDVFAQDRLIPIVPMRMLETWLLADVEAIKRVAGNRDAEVELRCMPPIARLEGIANAKDRLLEALCEASKAKGGKLADFKRRFNEMRARLATDLDPDGPVNRLSSYQAFRDNIHRYASRRLSPEDD
jgi:hypothetical protein